MFKPQNNKLFSFPPDIQLDPGLPAILTIKTSYKNWCFLRELFTTRKKEHFEPKE
jgi:hypothetical protein